MKRKLFFGLAGLAIMAAAVCVTVTTVNSNSAQSDLLSQNLVALTGDEYHQGTNGTNWRGYTIECTAYGASTNGGSWYWDSSIGAYVFSAGSGYGGGSSSGTSFEPVTFYKDVCGKGGGFCLSSAPDGHPCMG